MERPSILVVDNYDSFVYNLVQYLGELGATCHVVRNDEVVLDELARVDGVLVSPGPGHPRSAGRCLDVIHDCAKRSTPLFGVCLGHQALAEAFGARVSAAPELRHGRASRIEHDGRGVFRGLASPLVVGRYHSLAVEEATLGGEFEVSARVGDVVMAMRHRTLPLEGVQFHPESVLTQGGYLMLANWLESLGYSEAQRLAPALSERAEERRRALPDPTS
ncbi:MAG: gamma-glutamyl-gamma-aminobutyrate hydrolase family protein [Acidobacteria bacterium]|nr:gamma-glutamyl-gamma-aminobutyrate hydrolase family protein [Acidobacteriota bacterium]